MRQLLVLSGKGGTGKTSLTAALARLAAPLVLADCDVDAANLYLLAGGDSREMAAEVFSGGTIARVREDACTGCGICAGLCRFGAITLLENNGAVVSRIDPLACEGCGVCIDNCPDGAIDEPSRQVGELRNSQTALGPLVWGRLQPGRPNSGKLVALVRARARELAEDRQLPLVLVDGPPGVGCPVIASLSGIDAALLVAEPSRSSLHDLERVSQLCARFDIAPLVVINKASLHSPTTAAIARWCADQGIDVLGHIDYCEEFAHAAAAGQNIIDIAPQSAAARAIAEIWHQLRARLS
jgi:MinD superfamily P-loop ATPase